MDDGGEPGLRSSRRRAKSAEQGYFALILHAHLPFVRHPEHERFLEEIWLYEAITETYLPLLQVSDRLARDRIPLRLSLSLSPPLASMLADPMLQARFVKHIERLVELAEREVFRTRWLPDFHDTARLYLDKLTACRNLYVETYGRDLLGAFVHAAEDGRIDLMTSGATHGFLPLLAVHPASIRAQIQVAVQTHRRLLGGTPAGIWLPECGYIPGVEKELSAAGLGYFLVDTHGLLEARPAPRSGVHEPIEVASGVAAFGRDLDSSRSVWSATEGYPGDPEYRDFYRDVGFDLDLDYIGPYIHPDGIRIATGIKYHRITGATDDKKPYRPEKARERVELHAADFVSCRVAQVERLRRDHPGKPLIVSPYDAELFGHWWYEGPLFIEAVMRKMHMLQTTVKAVTLSEYLAGHRDLQKSELSYSSWGNGGYGQVWLNESNEWIYRHLHKAADRMIQQANRFAKGAGLQQERILNQMARELLLAQSSDWAFIMTNATAVEYAVKRTHDHISRFTRLHESLVSGQPVDETYLAMIESRDNLFPDIDFRVYADEG